MPCYIELDDYIILNLIHGIARHVYEDSHCRVLPTSEIELAPPAGLQLYDI